MKDGVLVGVSVGSVGKSVGRSVGSADWVSLKMMKLGILLGVQDGMEIDIESEWKNINYNIW